MKSKRIAMRIKSLLVTIALLFIVLSMGLTSAYGAKTNTSTPIKYVVVIFQENVSFDHYFGTYPNAANPSGEPAFNPLPGTPSVNGLNTELLTNNPNSANPVRLDRSEPLTCDQNHDYTPEQQAFDNGLMDKFVEFTDTENCAAPDISKPGLVMDYYDGNTVTALWNYAQHFAMSDNSYCTTFGPSAPGVLNLVGGQTNGVTPSALADVVANGTVIGDADPTFDDCSGGTTIAVSGIVGLRLQITAHIMSRSNTTNPLQTPPPTPNLNRRDRIHRPGESSV